MQKTIFILLCYVLLGYSSSWAQSVNDYRSVASGNWTTVSVWEVYNGTAWVAATTYPGQVAGTNDVSVEGGHTVVISSNITNSFNSLIVGDGTGAIDTLEVNANSSFNTLSWTVDDGGYASWTNNVTLAFPAGAAIYIIPSGSLDTSKPCSAAKRIQIGSTIYSTCNGGAGADYSFDDLNNGGGSLSVSPTSNSPLCIGATLTLFANPGGTGSGDSGNTFSWSATGPGGYTFSSSLENPTETGLSDGAYTYTVTISNGAGTITHTNTTDVTVFANPNPPTSGGDSTICQGGTLPTLTVTVNAGETADWYDAASGGTLLLSGSTSYTPTTPGSYFAETRLTTEGCLSTSRTEVVVNTRSCHVITNRNITYRVNPN